MSLKRKEPSISSNRCFDFAFLGHERSWIRRNDGPTKPIRTRPLSGGMHSDGKLEFVDVSSSSEYLEIIPSDTIRAALSDDLRCKELVTLRDMPDVTDPVLTSVSLRFRADATGGWALHPVEAEEAVQALMTHFALRYLGSQPKRINAFGLSGLQLSRLRDFVASQLSVDISISELSDLVSLSLSQFTRSFRKTTGLTPAQFITALRMEEARRRLLNGESVQSAAIAVNYQSGHGFRQQFHRHFGVLPAAYIDAVRD
ncbi:MAG: helix-turn-helix domain-containing protein [Pseudomonadota bacterium]